MRNPFRHKHRAVVWAQVWAKSVATGMPVVVMRGSMCKCGEIVEEEITPAGYQQLGWGGRGKDWNRTLNEELYRKLCNPAGNCGNVA